MQQQQPLLSLRMRSSRSLPPSERDTSSHDELCDRLGVMMAQEDSSTYKCRDYLLRRKAEGYGGPTNDIDTLCREKMCEWSYRVVDHFHASREIVAIAFSYLDRFVDRCNCDRTAFKLAAMTSIYMATKIFNSREISMTSLAELSRGEFERTHISEMEGIILKALGWRMHPPTVQCFINNLHGLLPLPEGPVTRAVYQRATFFAELSLFDYCFITQPRSAVAIAALLNAMEGMDEGAVSKEDHAAFYRAVCEAIGQEYPRDTIDSIRNRLWYVYSQSAQYQEDEILPPSCHAHSESQVLEKDLLSGDQSPVCVSVVTKA